MRGVFVGAGFNAFGIASAGGAGMALAEWVAKGEPPYRPLAGRHPPLRPQPPGHATGSAPARWRPTASTTPWPGRTRSTRSGRPLRRSPLYDRLKEQGACFGEKLGWERPNWFAGAGEEPGRQLQLRPAQLVRRGRPRAPGLPRAGGAVRPDLVRQVPHGRPRCRGALSWLCANDVAKPPGALVYTQLLNASGRHRVRPHRRAARRRPVLPRHRHRLRHPRFRLDRPQHSRGPRRAPDRRAPARMPCCRCSAHGRATSCAPSPPTGRQCRLPVRHLARDLRWPARP